MNPILLAVFWIQLLIMVLLAVAVVHNSINSKKEDRFHIDLVRRAWSWIQYKLWENDDGVQRATVMDGTLIAAELNEYLKKVAGPCRLSCAPMITKEGRIDYD